MGKLQLLPDESVRRSGGVSRLALGVVAGQLVLVVIAYWVLTRFLSALGNGSYLAAAFDPIIRPLYTLLAIGVALAVGLTFVVIVVRASFVQYGLTNNRVIKRSLLRSHTADLSHVQDVEVVQNLLGKLFGYCYVIVHTASKGGKLTLAFVDSPEQWLAGIHDSIRKQQMERVS